MSSVVCPRCKLPEGLIETVEVTGYSWRWINAEGMKYERSDLAVESLVPTGDYECDCGWTGRTNDLEEVADA